MAYATIEDLEASWRKLSDKERLEAERLLEEAAVHLDMMGASNDADHQKEALIIVSCNMVKRAMGNQ